MLRRTQSWLSWTLLLLGTLMCLAVAYAAYTLAGYSWTQVVDYKSPYVSAEVPFELVPKKPVPGEPLSKQVVLIIVDGLRDDVSRTGMPSLRGLRQYGMDMTLVAPQPSLSYPNWTTILTGATQDISGVTTNWYSGRVLAPTIMDVASAAGRRVAVVGPTDFAELYGVKPGPAVSLREWPKNGYLSGTLVDDALRIAKATDPQLMVVHLPDVDEAGHTYGGDSSQYRDVAGKVDADIARLVAGLQSPTTTFVVVADHGHINTGGHGGWETDVVSVPAIFSGAAVRLGTGTGELSQVAPTLAVLSGLNVPPYAVSTTMRSVIASVTPSLFSAEEAHNLAFNQYYVGVVSSETIVASAYVKGAAQHGGPVGFTAYVRDQRLALERSGRLVTSLLIMLAVLVVFLVVGIASWRALVAALAGTAAYYAIYNLLFFVVHRFLWSLSAFNTETNVKAFMNGRLVEAAISALVGVAVAAAVYPLLRRYPSGPRDRGYLGSWLALAPATLLVVLATLAVQVAWFLWYYGAQVTWILPNFMWGFKYDLDLIQMTAVGAVALLAPIVTYLIGRYHPRVRAGRAAV